MVLMWILLNKSTACYKQNYKQFQFEKKNYGFGLHTNPFSEQHYCLIILVFYTTICLTFQVKGNSGQARKRASGGEDCGLGGDFWLKEWVAGIMMRGNF